MSNEKRDVWTWCLHFERVSRTHPWEANSFCCPQAGSNGGPLNGWPRSRIRRGNPDLPETPQPGGRYSHFGD